MVILGLGSNLGDRLANLRAALKLIKQIPALTIKQVSPVYISDALLPENAPSAWDMPYLNLAVRCETALNPRELLHYTKNIEATVGRKLEKDWGPRTIDIDILAFENLTYTDDKLQIPHEHLTERPFALWPLADVAPFWRHPSKNMTAAEMVLAWGSRFSGNAPLNTKQIEQRIDTPELMGIVNITPDSFSDGGQFKNSDEVLSHIKNLVNTGAEIIDIGAESTGPHAQPLTPAAEWQRLEPILLNLISNLDDFIIRPKISIDTYHAETTKKCLDLNVDWINDVSGLKDPAMREVIKTKKCRVVIMHHLNIPENREISLSRNENGIQLIYEWAEGQLNFLEKNGITQDRIIFDVGIGYGKTAEQSLALIKNIAGFKKLNIPLLIGHSRKSFLQQFTHRAPKERDIESVVLSMYLDKQEINYLRLHDVEKHAKALKVSKSLVN